MRAKRDCQLPLTINLGEHDHVEELREISRILDANPEATEIVHAVSATASGTCHARGALRPFDTPTRRS